MGSHLIRRIVGFIIVLVVSNEVQRWVRND